MNRRFLLVPSTARGNGIGHIKRCCALLKHFSHSLILLPSEENRGQRSRNEITALFPDIDPLRIVGTFPDDREIEATLFDFRETEPGLFRQAAERGPVIGIDEGGSCRGRFDYLIDTLPGSFGRPNIECGTESALLREDREMSQPHRKGTPGHAPGAFSRVLVTFGGEDPAGLTVRTVQLFLDAGLFTPAELTAVQGPFCSPLSLPDGVALLEKPDDLASLLPDYDLVVTSFGLTAHEAAEAGAAVICVDPSRYHARLTRCAGFHSGGTFRPFLRALRRGISDPEVLRKTTLDAVSGRSPVSLHETLEKLDVGGLAGCPVCGHRGGEGLYRFSDRTIYSCCGCGILYQNLFSGVLTDYSHEYFFSEYKAQYGRSYLEDAPHIRELSLPRLRRIAALLGGSGGKTVLDVGCAYGPFLETARDEGFSCRGIDISADAVDYVRNSLSIPAAVFSFDQADFPGFPDDFPACFDAVTMWFVIEHFTDTSSALKRTADALPEGGIFAFSTPNAAGFDARRKNGLFFRNNPNDHYTIWTPRTARRIVSRSGFRVRRIKVTGHHPERWFPGEREGRKHNFLLPLLMIISRVFRLGNTFEVYAVKRGTHKR